MNYREALVEYIRREARPPDKFSHQARLYPLAVKLAEGAPFDDDVLFAAAWLHDLGVFIGHRPEDPAKLATWDHISYVVKLAPDLLACWGFPSAKIPAVLAAIESHLPSAEPHTLEEVLLRDADILEQLGAVGILRTVSKVGRDTRFILFSDALKVLRRNVEELPHRLKLESSKRHASERIAFLRDFLSFAEKEAEGVPW